ncbi:MAG: glycoside hydrolase family 127 protein [Planctomycetes bacterium]|nr:glycoside hydrolase family 127 protein [Planctomycetota bacterium]
MKEFDPLPYSGDRYQAFVPDTLDLAAHAELALNGLGGTTDPNMGYLHYFNAWFACRPPYMTHHGADTTCTPKFMESFPMMRLMCGSHRTLDLETAQREALLRRIQDGLYWNHYDPARPWCTSYNPAFDGKRETEDLANVGANGRMLRALVTCYELDPRSQWESAIRQLVSGLHRVAICREDYAYYPDGGFGEPFNYPRSGWRRTGEPKSEIEGGEGAVTAYQAHQIQGLARWHILQGDPQALDLAGRLTRFCLLPRFWGGVPDPAGKRDGLVGHVAPGLPDPACVSGEQQGHWFSHFHARAIAVRGVLEYGMAAGDERILEFVQRAYEYTWTLGIPRMGWVNCYPAALNLCEGCALGDLVALGIRLSDAGLGDYWDAVDAVARNQLVEQQLTRADLLERASASGAVRGPERFSPHHGQECREDVIPRCLGIFGGTATPTSIPNVWSMACCTGNATQGLYYAWESIVRETGDTAQVNLLLHRAARLVDVDSFLPFTGKVVLRNKAARRLSVRIPSWVDRRALRAEVSGSPRPLEWVANYLTFGALKPGDVITLTFPLRETTARYTVNARTPKEQSYTCTFRGSTLVDISPRDESATSYPLYQRSHLRQESPPMKTVTRFVPARTILRW